MGHEQLRILELRSMPGIRIKDQLRIRDMLLQGEGVDGRHHDVVAAVDDQRRLANFLQIGVALAARLAPFTDRGGLRLEGLDR